MRLLFLSSVFPTPHEPTRGTFNRCLVDALRLEHTVRVVAPVSWTTAWPRGARKGAPAASDATHVIHPTYYYPPRFLQHKHGFFMWQSIRRSTRAVLQSFAPEAVLSYWAHPDGEAALRTAQAAGVPMGLIVGGSDVVLLTREPKRRRAILRVLNEADAIFPVGRDLVARVLALGVRAEKVHEFRQGVDSNRFFPGDAGLARERLGLDRSKRLILWVGHVVPVKGLDVLIEAASLLARDLQRFEIVLVGEGPLRGRLEQQATERGVRDLVRFVGAVRHEQLPDYYRAADLTVLSSWSEGVPNVLLESLACGTPFVATRVGSIADLTLRPDEDLVAAGDPLALAAAMARHLHQPLQERTAIVKYRWSDTASNVASVLASLPRRRVSG